MIAYLALEAPASMTGAVLDINGASCVRRGGYSPCITCTSCEALMPSGVLPVASTQLLSAMA